MGDKPTVVRNPADDQDFARAVDDLIAVSPLEPGDAELRLRRTYPRAVVRRRELADEHVEVWYVYRDGHWVRGD